MFDQFKNYLTKIRCFDFKRAAAQHFYKLWKVNPKKLSHIGLKHKT